MNRFTRAAALGLVLATAAPMVAEAQDRGDRRENRRDYREDRRDDHRDWRRGDYDNRREYRHDRRDFRREQRWDRHDQNWWRYRNDFRDYRGARNGYWYAPSYGYYRVEPRYYGQRWRRGHYLPHAYRSYYVRDPYVYNLRPAPRGYRYVHADNDIVMIAVATGLIASVLSGVY